MTDFDREEALARLKEYRDQLDSADEMADKASLERAADLALLYDDKSWVDDLPPAKPDVTGKVNPESMNRFTKWVAERVGLQSRTTRQLYEAHDVFAGHSPLRLAQTVPTGERSVRPLIRLRKHVDKYHGGPTAHQQAVPDVWALAVEKAGGDSPDSRTVAEAVSEWKKTNLPKVTKKRQFEERTAKDASRRILTEARWMYEHGYYGDLAETYKEIVELVKQAKEQQGLS